MIKIVIKSITNNIVVIEVCNNNIVTQYSAELKNGNQLCFYLDDEFKVLWLANSDHTKFEAFLSITDDPLQIFTEKYVIVNKTCVNFKTDIVNDSGVIVESVNIWPRKYVTVTIDINNQTAPPNAISHASGFGLDNGSTLALLLCGGIYFTGTF
jgi:hypothetical protein